MRYLAPLSAGIFAYLGAGLVVGYLPALRIGRRAPNRDRREWLAQAGVPISPSRFWLLSLGTGLIGFSTVMLATGLLALSVVLGVAMGLVPRIVVGRRRTRRLASVREAWPDGVRDLVASISSGTSVARAIETLAATGPEPLRRAFERFPLLSRSIGVAPSLEVIRQQLADPTSDRVIEVLMLSHERGGTLVRDILSDLAAMTSRDLWTLEQIRTATLEMKINARVVFVLPWLVLVALTASSDSYRAFYASGAGLIVVGIAAVASILGMLLVVHLGREPEEPRLLAGSEGS